MAEQLYTIPVNDAFDTDCECPVCAMYMKLENDALDYTLGPSYMEEDVRAMTDKMFYDLQVLPGKIREAVNIKRMIFGKITALKLI